MARLITRGSTAPFPARAIAALSVGSGRICVYDRRSARLIAMGGAAAPRRGIYDRPRIVLPPGALPICLISRWQIEAVGALTAIGAGAKKAQFGVKQVAVRMAARPYPKGDAACPRAWPN